MGFWLAFCIAERFDHGEGTSLTFQQQSFPSFDEAVQSLADMEVPLVAGQVTEANAYVVRAETMNVAADLLRAVFARHEVSPHVKLVERGIRTRRSVAASLEIQAVARALGELCITHQITDVVLSHAEGDEYRDRLVRHKEALEDLGYALRVMQAEMAGQLPPEMPPRGDERLGYRLGDLGGPQSLNFTSALSSLATEVSIAKHEATLAQHALRHRDHRLDEVIAELDSFAATVYDYS